MLLQVQDGQTHPYGHYYRVKFVANNVCSNAHIWSKLQILCVITRKKRRIIVKATIANYNTVPANLKSLTGAVAEIYAIYAKVHLD